MEKVEIERSAPEALHSECTAAALIENASNIARYMYPPSDIPYAIEYACHLLGDVSGKKVVSYGCGNGENTILLARRKAEVLAIDISPELIRIAEKRLQVNGAGRDVKL